MLVQFLSVRSIEYWMIYRGTAFVAVVGMHGSSSTPLPAPSASRRTFQSSFVSPVELNDMGEG